MGHSTWRKSIWVALPLARHQKCSPQGRGGAGQAGEQSGRQVCNGMVA